MGCFSLAVSNFGAMAMEPVGSVAGVGASLQGFISTGTGAVIGALIGRQYHGGTSTLTGGAVICGLTALALILMAERGRLFRQHHPEASALAPVH
jgi:MFS transporter, DHA1 family, multidrug resistance protein